MASSVRNTAIKRIQGDVREMMKDPSDQYYAAPLEDNMFDWHFTLRGPRDTEFEGGIYHGRILLPADYPFKPPNIMLLTPNGRFEVRKKICLSISAYHPEEWQPAWGVRLILEALISFMPTKGEGAIGALDYPPQERRRLAKLSCEYCCDLCGKAADLLPELKQQGQGEGGDSAPSKYADQIAQLHIHAIDTATAASASSGAAEGASASATGKPPNDKKDGGATKQEPNGSPASMIGEAIAFTRDSDSDTPAPAQTDGTTSSPQTQAAASVSAPPAAVAAAAVAENATPPAAAPVDTGAAPQRAVAQGGTTDHVDAVLHYMTLALAVALFALVYKKLLQMQGVLQ